MGYGRDALLLLRTCGGHECACGTEANVTKLTLSELGEQISAQHRRTAAASRASRMNILLVKIKYHGAAVLVALNKIYGLGYSDKILCRIGVKVGADIPFCIVGGTALALDTGGEQLRVFFLGFFDILIRLRLLLGGACVKNFG